MLPLLFSKYFTIPTNMPLLTHRTLIRNQLVNGIITTIHYPRPLNGFLICQISNLFLDKNLSINHIGREMLPRFLDIIVFHCIILNNIKPFYQHTPYCLMPFGCFPNRNFRAINSLSPTPSISQGNSIPSQ